MSPKLSLGPVKLIARIRSLFDLRPESPPVDETWFRGYHAFEAGKKHFANRHDQGALDSFDTAIACGRVDADLFGLRGSCLQALEWHLDAIDDFTRAISLEPQDCNTYFQRAMSKSSSGDQQGFLADIGEAVRLARVDNAITRIHNESARDMGHRSAGAMYELQALLGADTPAFITAEYAERAHSKGRRPIPSDAKA